MAPLSSGIVYDYYYGTKMYTNCTVNGDKCTCPNFYSQSENNTCRYIDHVPVQLSQEIVLLISIVVVSIFFYTLTNYIQDYANRMVDDGKTLSKLRSQNKHLKNQLLKSLFFNLEIENIWIWIVL